MKKPTKNAPKLKLTRTKIRELGTSELTEIQGGCTAIYCQTLELAQGVI